jgi:hypothetical protein
MATARSTDANAPGSPQGSRTLPRSVTRMTPKAMKPTIGLARTFNIGRSPISAIPAPPIEPRSAARGTARRTALPPRASPVLTRPSRTVTAIPIFQVSTASPVAR